MKQTVLRKIIRNKDRSPRGIAVAVRGENGIDYGFSLCNTTRDKWDKKLGVAIALARATANKPYQLPSVLEREQVVLDAYEELQARCLKYFSDLDPSLIVINEGDVENW